MDRERDVCREVRCYCFTGLANSPAQAMQLNRRERGVQGTRYKGTL
ncbi:hypothetical protein POX_c04040 [Penicillium oxalicum]|nr:hypothetical protein POX_c04040 [Penicillium oxalicum]KAI2791184.1 hypothetical protein POX_c04040 [Penicillium oxalicum]